MIEIPDAPDAPPETASTVSATVAAADWAAALKFVKAAVAVRGTVPVLRNVRITVAGETMTVTACNLDLSSVISIPAAGDDLDCTADYKALVGFVPKAGRVTLAYTVITGRARRGTLEISTNTGTQTLSTIAADEFPCVGAPAAWEPIAAIAPDVVARVVKQLVPATSTEPARPVLNGVLMAVTGPAITFAAADGFRLHVLANQPGGVLAPPEPGFGPRPFIIPRAAWAALGGLTGTIYVAAAGDTRQLRWTGDNGTVYTRTIDGQFPHYAQIVPVAAPAAWVQVRTADLIAALKTLAPAAKQTANVVRLDLTPDALILRSADGDGHISTATVPAQGGDGAGHIAADYTYLADLFAGHVGGVLAITTPGAPILCEPDSIDSLAVLMPMHLVGQAGPGNKPLSGAAPVAVPWAATQPTPRTRGIVPAPPAPPVKPARVRKPAAPVAQCHQVDPSGENPCYTPAPIVAPAPCAADLSSVDMAAARAGDSLHTAALYEAIYEEAWTTQPALAAYAAAESAHHMAVVMLPVYRALAAGTKRFGERHGRPLARPVHRARVAVAAPVVPTAARGGFWVGLLGLVLVLTGWGRRPVPAAPAMPVTGAPLAAPVAVPSPLAVPVVPRPCVQVIAVAPVAPVAKPGLAAPWACALATGAPGRSYTPVAARPAPPVQRVHVPTAAALVAARARAAQAGHRAIVLTQNDRQYLLVA